MQAAIGLCYTFSRKHAPGVFVKGGAVIGNVVRFQARQSDAAARAEAVVSRLGEHYRSQLRAREELPAMLAALVRHGESELAVQAIVLWGTGELEAHEVMRWVEQYAAVSGIREIGDRPLPDR